MTPRERQERELTSGDVIDVEFILGESKAPKRSEREIQEERVRG